MTTNTSEWSNMKKLKHSLLKRAFNQNRGGEVILLMQWRTALECHKNAEGAAIAQEFEQENAGQPRALRSLNLIMKNKGLSTVYKDAVPEEIKEEKAVAYIRPSFLERIYNGLEPYQIPLAGFNDSVVDRITLPSHEHQDVIDNCIEVFKDMAVKSNDIAYRVEDALAAKFKKPEYDDNEDAMDADEYVDQAIKLISNARSHLEIH